MVELSGVRNAAFALLMGAAALPWVAAAKDAPTPALALKGCRLEGGINARCGTLSVPENPGDPDGRRIDLSIAVVPAISRDARPDPLFLFAGGPGMGAQDFYRSVGVAFTHVRRERDIVLLDQRGTGNSNPLQCDFPDDLEQASMGPDDFARLARDCLATLDGDPQWYTTSVAVQDLEAVRVALGYGAINLYGSSYGTRVAQHYARKHPDTTRALILDGVVPPTLTLGPSMALDAQVALDAILDSCAKDKQCDAAFPALESRFAMLREQLARAPLKVTMPDPVTGKVGTGDFSSALLAGAVRLMSYQSSSAALLPLLIHEASSGNPVPLAAQAKMVGDSLGEVLAYGMHNAVVCSEDIPLVGPGDIDRQALQKTYMGELLIDGMVAMCRDWPRGPVDADLKQPLASKVPALLLSGDRDPVTPPAFGAVAAKGFSDQQHVVLPGQGHGALFLGCMPRLMREFLESGSAAKLDTSCTKTITAEPPFLDFAGPAP